MNNLKTYRRLAGLNQGELGALIGKDTSTIQRAESEASSAKLATFKKCAEALGITLAQIFADDRSEIEADIVAAVRSVDPKNLEQAADIVKTVINPLRENDQ